MTCLPSDSQPASPLALSATGLQEVAVDYNAGFTGALAGLVQLLGNASSSSA